MIFEDFLAFDIHLPTVVEAILPTVDKKVNDKPSILLTLGKVDENGDEIAPISEENQKYEDITKKNLVENGSFEILGGLLADEEFNKITKVERVISIVKQISIFVKLNKIEIDQAQILKNLETFKVRLGEKKITEDEVELESLQNTLFMVQSIISK